MKQKTLKLVMVALGVLLSINANAYDVEMDGIYYNLDREEKQAEVKSGDSKYTGKVVIPESFSHDGVTYSVTSIGWNAFYGCIGLTSLTIPNSVTRIGEGAFFGCSGLTSVTIPESVTSIGYYAFQDCYGLTSVNITDLASWCNIFFASSDSNPLYYANHLYLNGEEVKDLVIPNSVTSIGYYAFYWCSGLTSITIPNSVTSIGDYAFRRCSGLTSVTIGNSVTSIGYDAFWGCSGLTSVTISESVTSIGGGAFYNCSGLTSVTIPNSVTSIGEDAFFRCSGLTSVTIPNSVTSISEGAFEGCSGLTSVTIPSSVTSIGEYAFRDCSGLTSVTIGNGVTSIGVSAFAYCSELMDVYCYTEQVPNTNSSAFSNSYVEYATLHVPATSIDAYKTTEPWNGFGTIVLLEEEEIEIVPMEEDSEVAFDEGITEETDLTNTVIDNIYITIDAEQGDAYDAEDKSISLTSTVDETVVESIAGKDISDPAVREAFNGLILEVPEGTGTLSVTAQTTGNRVLNVKIGTKDVQSFTKPERGTAEIPYETGEQAYVYIYGGVASSSTKFRHAPAANSGTDVVKIYGIQWTSQSNSIEILNVEGNIVHQVFTLDGKQVKTLQKGVNIIRTSDGNVKKVFVK